MLSTSNNGYADFGIKAESSRIYMSTFTVVEAGMMAQAISQCITYIAKTSSQKVYTYVSIVPPTVWDCNRWYRVEIDGKSNKCKGIDTFNLYTLEHRIIMDYILWLVTRGLLVELMPP